MEKKKNKKMNTIGLGHLAETNDIAELLKLLKGVNADTLERLQISINAQTAKFAATEEANHYRRSIKKSLFGLAAWGLLGAIVGFFAGPHLLRFAASNVWYSMAIFSLMGFGIWNLYDGAVIKRMERERAGFGAKEVEEINQEVDRIIDERSDSGMVDEENAAQEALQATESDDNANLDQTTTQND